MKIGDAVTVIIILVVSVILLLIPIISGIDDADFVIIDDKRYTLSEDDVISLEKNGYHLTVIIENKIVYVSESDCPDNTCRMMGRISKSGQFITCVPAGIYIEIEGIRLNGDDFDSIAG